MNLAPKRNTLPLTVRYLFQTIPTCIKYVTFQKWATPCEAFLTGQIATIAVSYSRFVVAAALVAAKPALFAYEEAAVSDRQRN